MNGSMSSVQSKIIFISNAYEALRDTPRLERRNELSKLISLDDFVWSVECCNECVGYFVEEHWIPNESDERKFPNGCDGERNDVCSMVSDQAVSASNDDSLQIMWFRFHFIIYLYDLYDLYVYESREYRRYILSIGWSVGFHRLFGVLTG